MELITLLGQIEEIIPLQSYTLLEELQECNNMKNSVELEAAIVQGFPLGAQIFLEVQNRDIPNTGSISVYFCDGNSKKYSTYFAANGALLHDSRKYLRHHQKYHLG